MLPCHDGCAYRRNIVGDCHSQCVFDWGNSDYNPPTNQGSARTAKWFIFPANFDPVWGPDKCLAFSKKVDTGMIRESDPLFDLVSLMGKRLYR